MKVALKKTTSRQHKSAAISRASVRGTKGHSYKVLRGRVAPVDLLGKRDRPDVELVRRTKPGATTG
jgi:hypothetical protein